MIFILGLIIIFIIISLSSTNQADSADGNSCNDNKRNDVVSGSFNYSSESSYMGPRGMRVGTQDKPIEAIVIKDKNSITDKQYEKNKQYDSNQELDSVIRLFMRQSPRDVGYSIKQVLQGCDRSTPFSNKNVVATVGFMSIVGTVSVQEGSVDSFKVYCGIKESVCMFSSGEISWSDFVKVYWDVTRNCKIPNTATDSILTRFEEMAYEIMDYVDSNGIRGDLHWGPMRSILGK